MPLLCPNEAEMSSFACHQDHISACRQSLDIRRQSTSSRHSQGSRRQSMSHATRYSSIDGRPTKYSGSLLETGESNVPTIMVSLHVLSGSLAVHTNRWEALLHAMAVWLP